MDDVSHAPIIGHAPTQANVLQKSKSKNREPKPKPMRTHVLREIRMPNARIQRKAHARVEAWPRRVTYVRGPLLSAHASHAHFNHDSRHTISMGVSTGGAHASRADIGPRHVHLACTNKGRTRVH